MAKQPLIVVEFTTPLDEMSDAEIDALASEIADSLAATLADRQSMTDVSASPLRALCDCAHRATSPLMTPVRRPNNSGSTYHLL
jgi:hypothetical protein